MAKKAHGTRAVPWLPTETCTRIHRFKGSPKAVQGGSLFRCFPQESQNKKAEFRELHFVFVVARLNLRRGRGGVKPSSFVSLD